LRLLVTAGPTREPIDDVRYISNASSGKLGFALCEAALERGHEVTLVLGPVEATPPPGVTLVRVETTSDLDRACRELFPSQDALIMAAAPADFRVANRVHGKISKEGRSGLTLELALNPDVVAGLGKTKRPGQAILGFALEAGEGAEPRARAKLERKNLDAIALNGPQNLGSDRASVTLIARTGAVRELRDLAKKDLARELVKEVEALVSGLSTNPPPR
jgi:phosphopantothenoylcysteine decarboxylase/phosphopantothenate--cysteine ligase